VSISPIPPPDPPLIPPDPSAQPEPFDQTTLACLRYYPAMRGDDLMAQADSFNAIVAICYAACSRYRSKAGHQLFFRDDWPSYNVHIPEPAIEVAPTHLLAADLLPCVRRGRSRRENTNHDRLRDWIVLYVLNRLAPYLDKIDEEIQQAAADGKFHYLPRLCVLAFRKKVARSFPKDGEFHRVSVSLDTPYVATDPQDGEDNSLVANLLGPDLNLDFDFDPHALLPIVTEPDNHAEFERLGVSDVLEEVVRDLGTNVGPTKKGDTVRRVAARLGVGERQARNRIKSCFRILEANRREPAVREFFDASTRDIVAAELPSESRESKFRRRVLSQAATDKWDGISAYDIKQLKAEEDALEPGDFVLDGNKVRRIARPKAKRRASQVDELDTVHEFYFEVT
jgi:hypothetical protein